MDTDELALVTDAIAAAPFRPEGWTTALASMARATGGWGGQLIAQARDRFEFDSVVNLPPEAFKDYVAHRGNDPAHTPRLRAALSGPPMKAVCDEDYITAAGRSRWPIYRDLYEPYDAHYCVSARLADHQGRSLSVVLFHSRGGGPYERAQIDAVDLLLPHLRRAFEVRLAIEAEAASMALGAFEALAQPAIVCAASGRLIGASAAGEAALRSGNLLTVRGGVVRAASPACAAALERAIRHAAAPIGLDAPPAGGVRLVDAEGRRMRLAAVTPFPPGVRVNLAGAVLIVLPPERRPPDSSCLQGLGLSPAEAAVALLIAEGRTPGQIAARRGVGLETIRSQLKSLYAKLDVRGAAQLGARLRDLF